MPIKIDVTGPAYMVFINAFSAKMFNKLDKNYDPMDPY